MTTHVTNGESSFKGIIEAQSQTDLVRSRSKQATLNSIGPISMEADDKQHTVAQSYLGHLNLESPQNVVLSHCFAGARLQYILIF